MDLKNLIKENRIVYRILQSPVGARLLKGGFWSLAGNVLSKGLVLLSTIAIAHILGKTGYGEYSMIRTTIFMFIALASVGVGATTTKYISQYRNSDIQKAYNIYVVSSIFSIIFGLLTSILIFIFAGWIATNQLDAPYLSESICYGALLMFFCTVNGAQNGALSGFENFKDIAINSFISSIVEICMICILALRWGINGALIGSGIGYVVLTIINHRSINRNFSSLVQLNIKQIKKDDVSVIWKFGVPAALCNVLVLFALWISRAYLVRETNFGEVAIYNAADQVKTFILFIPTALSVIILPILTNVKHTSDTNTYNSLLRYNIFVNVGISLIIALIVCLLANPILSLWGNGFEEPLPLIILSLSAIFSSFATVIGQAIASQGKMWTGFMFNLIWAALVVGLAYYFIARGMGATGLALSILCAYILHGLYQYVYLKCYLIGPRKI